MTKLEKVVADYRELFENMRERNHELEKVLEYYAEAGNAREVVMIDRGYKAREALRAYGYGKRHSAV